MLAKGPQSNLKMRMKLHLAFGIDGVEMILQVVWLGPKGCHAFLHSWRLVNPLKVPCRELAVKFGR